MAVEYLAYKGKTLIARGTLDELAIDLDVTIDMLKIYASKHYVEVARKQRDQIYLVKVTKAIAHTTIRQAASVAKTMKPRLLRKKKLTNAERMHLFQTQTQLEFKHCHYCPKNSIAIDPSEKCGGCKVYEQLREIGDVLQGHSGYKI